METPIYIYIYIYTYTYICIYVVCRDIFSYLMRLAWICRQALCAKPRGRRLAWSSPNRRFGKYTVWMFNYMSIGFRLEILPMLGMEQRSAHGFSARVLSILPKLTSLSFLGADTSEALNPDIIWSQSFGPKTRSVYQKKGSINPCPIPKVPMKSQ